MRAAIRCLQACIAKAPRDVRARTLLATLLSRYTDNEDEAEHQLGSAVSLGGSLPQSRTILDANSDFSASIRDRVEQHGRVLRGHLSSIPALCPHKSEQDGGGSLQQNAEGACRVRRS